ncbi:SagB/ThcOx family dehydrogenase, partial [Staphylococcus pseudintermedius]|nr:SagB/ThcOx family dehydrogenase [Staphylococcus pseudintermedius]
EFQDTGSDEDKEIASNHYKKLIREKKAPDLYKNYINSSFISLPKSEFKTTKDFYKVLMNRKTHREFGEVSLDINEFSEILYMATQDARVIRKKVSENIVQNPNLYTNSVFTCNEIYLYINNVSNIPPGIYHYDMKSHGLNHLNNLPDKSAGYYCYGQPEIENANCIIFISANYHKYMWRYNHERAYRNLLIDVAQLAQSFLLAATNLQKKTFLTPALRDSELVKLFDLEEYIEDIRYLVAIGN